MDLKFEDLMLTCKECEGTGEVPNPALSRNQGGFGMRVISPLKVDCNTCQGKGMLLTESGKAVLKFIQLAKNKHFLYY